eukprot:gene36213-22575_t
MVGRKASMLGVGRGEAGRRRATHTVVSCVGGDARGSSASDSDGPPAAADVLPPAAAAGHTVGAAPGADHVDEMAKVHAETIEDCAVTMQLMQEQLNEQRRQQEQQQELMEMLLQYGAVPLGGAAAAGAAVPAATASSSDEGPAATPAAVCAVCYDHPADHCVVPCGHQCACGPCLIAVRSGDGLCPICRCEIKDILKVYNCGVDYDAPDAPAAPPPPQQQEEGATSLASAVELDTVDDEAQLRQWGFAAGGRVKVGKEMHTICHLGPLVLVEPLRNDRAAGTARIATAAMAHRAAAQLTLSLDDIPSSPTGDRNAGQP